jgi:hypothetical protein
MRLPAGLIIVLALMALMACSGVEVRPNPSNPAYLGSDGPGGRLWNAGPGASGVW